MTIIHRGVTVIIREGFDGTTEIKTDGHREVFDDKTFGQTARYALKWIMDNGGAMKGDYERKQT